MSSRERIPMSLEEIRIEIDALDQQLKALLMQRLDCSRRIAEIKAAAGDAVVYRAEREEEILRRLGADVPEERRAEYLAVVRKIIETSRMYQYGLLCDWGVRHAEELPGMCELPAKGSDKNSGRVRIQLTRPNRPNAMSAILSMIGDYGFDMESMELLCYGEGQRTVSFALTIRGDIGDDRMRKLLLQLSGESDAFKILESGVKHK